MVNIVTQLSGFGLNWEKTLHIRVLITKGPRIQVVEDSSGRQLFKGRCPECQKSGAIIRSVVKVDLHLSPLDP